MKNYDSLLCLFFVILKEADWFPFLNLYQDYREWNKGHMVLNTTHKSGKYA